jgi:transcriptional regulator with XRE-family HTH domain
MRRVQMITVDQLKTARRLLRWSQLTLSLEASVDLPAISGFETGRKGISEATAAKVLAALQRAGIELPEGKPARLRRR